MRHRFGHRKFGLTTSHRRAMLRNMANALIQREQVRTTLHRAKELRRFVEPLMTRGKRPTVANRRLVFARLRDRDSVVKIFNDLGERFAARPGGYTRIVKGRLPQGRQRPDGGDGIGGAPQPGRQPGDSNRPPGRHDRKLTDADGRAQTSRPSPSSRSRKSPTGAKTKAFPRLAVVSIPASANFIRSVRAV